MAKGNVHKMQAGYKRSQEKTPTTVMLAQAHNEEAERIHELCLEEMEADYCFGDYYSDDDLGFEEPMWNDWDLSFCDPMGQYYDSLAGFF